MGGELVSVFISLKGFTRDEELALFCGAPKGGSMGAAVVRQTATGLQEERSNMRHGRSISYANFAF